MRYTLLALLVATVAPALTGCNGELPTEAAGQPAASPPALSGSIEVAIQTTGNYGDLASFTLSVDGSSFRAIGNNETMTATELGPGPHTVWLSGMADGWELSGDNPRLVSVTAGGETRVTFHVVCGG